MILKIGIIGFGNIGLKRFQALKKIKNKKIQIVFISDLKKNKQVPKNITFFTNWREALKIKVDLLIISTPTSVTDLIIDRLDGNTSCLIEKPISTNFNKLIKLTKKFNKNKKILKVGYNLRFDNGIQLINYELKKKSIGKIYYIKISYANGAALTNSNNVGSLIDMGAHSFNLLKFFFKKNKIKKILELEQKNEYLNKRKVDNGFLFYKINNILVEMHHGFCSWKNTFNLEIYGRNGYYKVISLPKWGKQSVIVGKRKFPSGIPVEKFYSFYNDDSWYKEINFVIKNLKNNIKNIREINMEAINSIFNL